MFQKNLIFPENFILHIYYRKFIFKKLSVQGFQLIITKNASTSHSQGNNEFSMPLS